MAPSINRILKGQKASYKLLELLKPPSLHKAVVLPASNSSNPTPAISTFSGLYPKSSGEFVVVKDLQLERELRVHQLPSIQSCKYIRQAIDIIEKSEKDDWTPSESSVNKRIVLEWMDTDLWQIRPFGNPFANQQLPAIVSKSILEALVVFKQERGVHTDVNPNNIFISNLGAPIPTVKLGDLDNAFSEGVAKNFQGAQTHETRAPEVWQGFGVWHSSDIWSLGVTIAHWLVWHIEPPENPDFKDEFALAEALEGGGYLHPETGEAKPYISVGTLREELLKLPREICSEACIDFIEHLLVIDPAQRPTAEMALKHPFAVVSHTASLQINPTVIYMNPFTPKAGYGQELGNSIIPHIFRLDEHRVLKKGRHECRETDAMQFITTNTTIPVPKVHDTKFDKEKNVSYIVMDYVPGKPLDKVWKELNDAQRASTCRQLGDYLTQLRNLTSERIESVNNDKVRTGFYKSRWGGPFDNEKEFNDFLAAGAQDRPADNHGIHFAHGDLSPRNILVNDDGHITAILDWEWAGWYPEYWDFVWMYLDMPGKKKMPDYAIHLQSAFPHTYKEEYFTMLNIIRLESPGPGGTPVQPAASSN
ncbi:hypothetical protein LOZ12_002099 [Ophidiomyces ophidiicola]|uniref:uncharacterized protein n=1 Tax=Ophidiomyces ophidiicola TaxID=1387563 RepID=UPI0020C4CB1F|nr:uncharacterized protein LOZ57_002195 [Ophidiomyces ophidiicola]KAI1948000.1 hypothetical protein LOZ62_002860 [Ophidiomyces ophidiicola]KAI1949720.1 hypothetical protein LOZ57_002195 [Ophidiomyces ophidiicola]KAI1961618.1 hypothetical protein LOZ59_002422 [Ophidiomyces ophidiicola]KAI1974206.1 hypothetical protein LOZ56_001409 [Ophidiomyces ophidiicola]KAI2028576.1 hypothetical protein LOZ45_002143 [Ophidiomyces ophidiicola]